MDLHIMKLSDAIAYEPVKKTYAIRIFNPRYLEDWIKFTLKKSPLFIHESIYLFDDVFPDDNELISKGYVLFDESMAEKMLTDFDSHKRKCETLLVHCIQGNNRAPAIGIAFSEIYKFGQDTEALKRRYPESNWHVYRTLKKVAGKRC